jgi:thermolabile hemolysin
MEIHASIRKSRGMLSACILSLLGVSSIVAQTFSGIVSFGDSWSDAGNANQISNGAALPLMAAPYANGRYSNGYLWVDYLADRMQIQRGTAERVSSVGTNFAHGGARLDDGNRFEGVWKIREVGGQVSSYLSRFSPSGGELFTFFAGGNDIASGDVDLSDEIGRLSGYVGSIYAGGGRTFLMANIPDFGKFPDFKGNASMTAATASYNQMLKSEIAALRLLYPDAVFHEADFHGALEAVYADPSAHGFNPGLKDTSYAGDFEITDLWFEHRSHISNYMWIDGIHPTDKLHQIFGEAAFEAMMVPEPSVAVLMGGVTVLFGFTRRREGRSAPSSEG